MVTDNFRLKIIADILQLDASKMIVLMNLPKLSSLTKSHRQIRKESGFLNKKLVVYAGGLSAGRHLEEIISAFRKLPETHALAYIGYGSEEYKACLIDLARDACVSSRFKILPPVRWSDIPEYISSADCALALYEKCSINNIYCSPSKLFDAVIAGVPVVGTNNPLIVEVLGELDAGETIGVGTPAAIAEAIDKLIARDNTKDRRAQIASAAIAKYTWERQEEVLVDLYAKLEYQA